MAFNRPEDTRNTLEFIAPRSPYQKYTLRTFLWSNKFILTFSAISLGVWATAEYRARELRKRREVQKCDEFLAMRYGVTYRHRFPNGKAHFPNGWSDLEKMGYTTRRD